MNKPLLLINMDQFSKILDRLWIDEAIVFADEMCCGLGFDGAHVFPRNLGETPWLYWWQAAIPDRRVLAEMPLLQLCWKFIGTTGMALDLQFAGQKTWSFQWLYALKLTARPWKENQLSNEQNHGCLGYIGDYTTQICGDYLTVISIPVKQPV